MLGPGAYNLPDTKTKVGTKFNAPKASGSSSNGWEEE